MAVGVSIVIPTLNEEKNIGRLLDAINKTGYSKKEVIVVDGGSKDRTVEIAKMKGAKVVKEYGKQKCCANAKNIGSRKAKYGVILILNADSERINKRFIHEGVKILKKKENVGVAPEIIPVIPTFWSKALHHSRNLFNLFSSFPWFPNFIRKNVFNEIGGYPVSAYEDRIFMNNFVKYMTKNGKRCPKTKNCKLYLKDPDSFSKVMSQIRWYSRVAITHVRKSRNYKELTFYLVSLMQPIGILSFFFLSVNPIFYILAGLYTIKILLMIFYAIFFNGTVSNSRYYVFATPLIDFIGGVYKYLGIIDYVKMSFIKSGMIYSRGE